VDRKWCLSSWSMRMIPSVALTVLVVPSVFSTTNCFPFTTTTLFGNLGSTFFSV
jgi:hypothetical protein